MAAFCDPHHFRVRMKSHGWPDLGALHIANSLCLFYLWRAELTLHRRCLKCRFSEPHFTLVWRQGLAWPPWLGGSLPPGWSLGHTEVSRGLCGVGHTPHLPWPGEPTKDKVFQAMWKKFRRSSKSGISTSFPCTDFLWTPGNINEAFYLKHITSMCRFCYEWPQKEDHMLPGSNLLRCDAGLPSRSFCWRCGKTTFPLLLPTH